MFRTQNIAQQTIDNYIVSSMRYLDIPVRVIDQLFQNYPNMGIKNTILNKANRLSLVQDYFFRHLSTKEMQWGQITIVDEIDEIIAEMLAKMASFSGMLLPKPIFGANLQISVPSSLRDQKNFNQVIDSIFDDMEKMAYYQLTLPYRYYNVSHQHSPHSGYVSCDFNGFGLSCWTDFMLQFRLESILNNTLGSSIGLMAQTDSIDWYWTAHYLIKKGHRVTVIAFDECIFFDEMGLDLQSVFTWSKNCLSLEEVDAVTTCSLEEVFGIELDALILTGYPMQIDLRLASKISAPIIIEGSHLTLTTGANDWLVDKGKTVLPSTMACTAYPYLVYEAHTYKSLVDKHPHKIQERYQTWMKHLYRRVCSVVHGHNVSLQKAAMIIALQRLSNILENNLESIPLSNQ